MTTIIEDDKRVTCDGIIDLFSELKIVEDWDKVKEKQLQPPYLPRLVRETMNEISGFNIDS